MRQASIRNTLLSLYMLAVIMLLASSCVKDILPEPTIAEEGTAWVDFTFGNEDHIELVTKSHQTVESENLVSDLFVFIFDASGNKVFNKYFDASNLLTQANFRKAANKNEERWYVNNSNGETATSGGFRIHTPVGNNQSIYCITNLDSDRTYVSSALLSRTIHHIDDLRDFELFLNVDSVNRGNKFTSCGSIGGVNVTEGGRWSGGNYGDGTWVDGITGKSNISLRRVDAKVKFTFRMGNRPDSRGQTVKYFIPNRWKIVNVPRKAYLIERANEDASNPAGQLTDEQYADYAADYFDTEWRVFEEYLTNTSGSFAFYMLENRLQPKNSSITEFYQRSLRAKDATKKNRSIEVDYTEITDSPATKVMRQFEYANDFSTYVLVEGRVEMDLVDDSEGQVLGADVQYLIHLGGNWHRTSAGAHWDEDTYSGSLDNFDTKRNHSYNYIVTINSVDNIRVEVETSEPDETFAENQPGAWGNVTIAREEIAVCDAHYVSKTLSFHANNLVKEGTSNADKLTWAVNTPFSEIAYDYGNPDATPLSTIDYKWVHFRLNKKNEDGQYYENKRRKYTTRPFSTSETLRLGDRAVEEGGNLEDDGTDGLSGYHNDGIMDIVQLVDYMKKQSQMYAEWSVDHNKPVPDFDDLFDDLGHPKPLHESNPKISVTVFVDEYYYERNPLSLTESPTLWKRFVNANDRYMHILSDSNMSYDGDSRSTGSVITIQQKAIQSIYNIDEGNEELTTAWGLEHEDEYPDMWKWKVAGADGRYNTSNQNGYLNTLRLWDLCGTGNTIFTSSRRWGSYMDIEVENEVPQLGTNYLALKYSCMTRNRDNNGNGQIDEDEVRWYTASVGQLINLYMGEACISPSSRLYNREANDRRDPTIKRSKWMQHVVSSTAHNGGNTNSPTIIWAEEGVSTGQYHDGLGEGAAPEMTVRCIRNLGMKENNKNSLVSTPEPIVKVTRNGSVYSYDMANLMPQSKREYVSEEMPRHFETDPLNLLYDKFESNNANTTFTSMEFEGYNDALDTRIRNNQAGYCPAGYRTPNQREVAVMKYFAAPDNSILLNGSSCMTRTAWSMGMYQPDLSLRKSTANGQTDQDKHGFILNKDNITLSYNGSITSVRCVRDIRVR